MQLIKEINNYGDARRMILQTMIQLRDGEIEVSRGMAIAASMKVLNDNIQCRNKCSKAVLDCR